MHPLLFFSKPCPVRLQRHTRLTIGRGVQGGSSLIEYRGASLFCIKICGKGDEVRIDLRKIGEDERQKREQQEWLFFRLNHTFYLEPGYKELMRELFAGKIGENSFVKAPLSGAELSNISIGKYAVIGAALVVTHDVGNYEVVVGNPAKCIKRLEPEKFEV